MALLEEWVLPRAVKPDLVATVEAALRRAVDARFKRAVVSEAESVYASVWVSSDELVELAKGLDRPLSHFDGWEWEAELEPPKGGGDYELRIEMVNKGPSTFEWLEDQVLPILSVYSKHRNNREAWPAAFVLAARLAHELGAVEPDTYPRQPN